MAGWQLDMDTLTVGELEDLADAMGVTDVREFDRIATSGAMPPKMVTAVVMIMKRKDNPGFTLADARNVPVSEIARLFADPNDDGGQTASSPQAPSDSSGGITELAPRRRGNSRSAK